MIAPAVKPPAAGSRLVPLGRRRGAVHGVRGLDRAFDRPADALHRAARRPGASEAGADLIPAGAGGGGARERLGGRSDRAAARVHLGHGGVSDRLGALWGVAHAGRACGRALGAGAGRLDDDAGGPADRGGLHPARAAGGGHDLVHHAGHHRPAPRPAHRRADPGQAVVALDLLHQHPCGPPRRVGGDPLRAQAAPARSRTVRRAGLWPFRLRDRRRGGAGRDRRTEPRAAAGAGRSGDGRGAGARPLPAPRAAHAQARAGPDPSALQDADHEPSRRHAGAAGTGGHAAAACRCCCRWGWGGARRGRGCSPC